MYAVRAWRKCILFGKIALARLGGAKMPLCIDHFLEQRREEAIVTLTDFFASEGVREFAQMFSVRLEVPSIEFARVNGYRYYIEPSVQKLEFYRPGDGQTFGVKQFISISNFAKDFSAEFLDPLAYAEKAIALARDEMEQMRSALEMAGHGNYQDTEEEAETN